MWESLDQLCFKSKNLYNYANYIMRQSFINKEGIISYNDLTYKLKHSEPFKDLGSNSSQHTLKMLCRDWKSFMGLVKGYKKNPQSLLGKPTPPKYKNKNGRHICVLTNMQSQIKDNCLYFAFKELKQFNDKIKTSVTGRHLQTRIIPKGGCYILEIVYEVEIEDKDVISKNIVGIDLGVNNFVTISNNIGVRSIVINGKGIKSYNKHWNKKVAKCKSLLKTNNGVNWSKNLEKLYTKRYNKMEYYMHKSSKTIIDYCKGVGADTLVLGINKGWKQNSKMSKVVNQTFIQIPYDSLINKLAYKCENEGIVFITTEESFTSGTSFLDNELPTKENYNKKRRIHRGLFKSNKGILINSDLNGAYQITKKVFPNAFEDGIEDADLHPIVINCF